MTAYVQVLNGAIRGTCGDLPATWIDPDGAYRTDLAALSDADLNKLGWVAVLEAVPTFDPAAFTASPGPVTMLGGIPRRAWTLTAVPQPAPPPLMPISHEQLVALLLQKGTLAKTDIDATVIEAAVAAQPDAARPIMGDVVEV